MGNNRGNFFSDKHITLDTSQKEFWDAADFEEMGLYDLPAEADYIKTFTGKPKMSFVGHSMATTMFFIGASMKPEYFEQTFNLFVAMAPITRLDHSSVERFAIIAKYENVLSDIFQALGVYNLLPNMKMASTAEVLACKTLPSLCKTLLVDSDEMMFTSVDNPAVIEDYMAHNPAGNGWKNLAHYA